VSSPKQDFQTAVDKTPSRDEREDAIDRLVENGACDKLAILVQMGGFEGALRRRTLNGMVDAGCRDLLRTLVNDGSLGESLRSDAESLFEEYSRLTPGQYVPFQRVHCFDRRQLLGIQ
jgi:hypothetical protein